MAVNRHAPFLFCNRQNRHPVHGILLYVGHNYTRLRVDSIVVFVFRCRKYVFNLLQHFIIIAPERFFFSKWVTMEGHIRMHRAAVFGD